MARSERNAQQIIDKIGGRPVILSLSGGKDSAATALYLQELGVPFTCIFMDTGWEHEDTYAYLRGPLEERFGPVEWLSARAPDGSPMGMVDVVRSKAMFPSRVRRFCTQQLKVYPARDYFRALCTESVNAVGIRAAESEMRAKFAEWEWSDTMRADVWRPIIDWSEEDVIEIHKDHGLMPNPLYLKGASRVGCWPCIFARKAEVGLVAKIDPERIDLLADLEQEITAAADARAAQKGETNQHPRTWFAGRGPKAVGGRAGAMPIREIVEWTSTGKGGLQFALLDDAPEGCARWGLCGYEDGGWPEE